VRVLWSSTIPVPLRGLVLAREPGRIFAWNASSSLFSFASDGSVASHALFSAAPSALACADDGSTLAAGSLAGQVWWLNGALEPSLGLTVPARVTSLASTTDGEHLAIADGQGGLRVVDRRGRKLWNVTTPRPLHHLAFVPEAGLLVGCADHGLVCCFDQSGTQRWRDGLVANVGSLASSGSGHEIALACFSEGLLCYAIDRSRPEPGPWSVPCRLGALAWDGATALLAELDGLITLRDRTNRVVDQWKSSTLPVALALAPLADQAVVGTAEGRVFLLETSP
jgi:hypothetical protein